ncbi:hypothetical protein NJBCHELONAE_43740 [Mycobacteroides chelonae]|uniref:DUF7246 family protein n=1 Tax=Mycobacteroides chelonae TaxID=1774 RepID=UPI0021DDADC9|nr:hypothetical protein [Mycobacteroides chelonae]GLE59063.1 hypothetical protein NJBCHELONAE_43740 [Mycobacteroides chelonae]
MKQTKTIQPAPQEPGPEVIVKGHTLTEGDQVKISRERGTFTFHDTHLTAAEKVVCNFTGPGGFRSFYADRVKAVTRKAPPPKPGK